MATVSGIGGSAAGAASDVSRPMGREDFLKLFITQMTNQDPTAPSDSTQMLAQLAQFSSLEQLETANSRLDSLLLAGAASNATGAASLAGRQVAFRSDRVELGASGATLRGEVTGPAAQVTWTIRDSNGKVVRTLTSGETAGGRVELAWDGRDDDGHTLATGTYTVSMAAADQTGGAVETSTRSEGRVDAVTFESGYPELIVGGRTVKMNDVTRISAPEGAGSGT